MKNNGISVLKALLTGNASTVNTIQAMLIFMPVSITIGVV